MTDSNLPMPPDTLTLIAFASAMEMFARMRAHSPIARYEAHHAAAVCSLAPMAVMAYGGETPNAVQYVHPHITASLSDADIVRIADAVRPAPEFAGQGAYKRQHRNMPVSFDADGQPIPADKGGLE